MIQVRPAADDDADPLADILNAIIEAGGTTAHRNPFDAGRMLNHHIRPQRSISCFVAQNGNAICGFQALEWADPNWDGPDPMPADYAVIATFVAGATRGGGVGRALFAETRAAADAAGVTCIDATIGADNPLGLAYYAAIGFAPYGRLSDIALSDGQLADFERKRYEI